MTTPPSSDSDDREELCEWLTVCADGATQRAPTPISTADFIATVDSTNFFLPSECQQLYKVLLQEARPWLPFGRNRIGDACRLVPNPNALRPQELEYRGAHRDVVAPHILGFNKTCMWMRLTRDDRTPGFVFHQLGYLEVFLGQGVPTEASEGPWHKTRSFIVARVGETGRIDGVYMVWADIQGTPSLYNPRLQLRDGRWGWLRGEMFRAMRLGDRLGDFGFSKRIVPFEDVLSMELVRVARMADGSLMRVTLVENLKVRGVS